jgi:hypothetical protein
MTTNDNDFSAKTSTKYFCKKCDYGTCKKFNFDIHCESKKHKNNDLTTNNNSFLAKTSTKKYPCQNCNKDFNDRAGLWRHKKKCCNNDILEENQELKEFMKYLMKENTEMKNMMMEVIKNGTHNTNTTNNNSHNKMFNIQFFLNETCKDAMNIMDFAESVKLQLSDLENVGKLGYVDGISNIIIKNLKALDVEKRPVHCTDSKREILYIKDDDKWEKENEDNNRIKKVIKKIANKNSRLITQFKEKHPDCGKSDSLYSHQYNKLIVEAMGGPGDNDCEKENKIIKNLAKEVIIDKNKYSTD